jgi:putative phage-type endonuclease
MIIQGTPEWHQARLGRVTASRIADVMMVKSTAGYQNYRAQLICERLTGNPTESFTSAAMQHGTDTEPQARAFYEMETGHDVQQVGFINHSTLFAGVSPDGLIGDLGGVEIKCPQPAEHIRTITGGAIKRGYVLQMQWGMVCTGRTWWDFASFCPMLPDEMQMHRQTVVADYELHNEMSAAVASFLADVDAACADLANRYKRAA